MNPAPRPGPPHPRPAAALWLRWALLALLLLSGCRSPDGPKPGRTKLSSRLIDVPIQVIGNLVVVETSWDRHGPWRFLVDTGSSVTLVSPEFDERYHMDLPPRSAPSVRVRGAGGELTTLRSTAVRRIELGDARFDRVQALVFDTSELSAHLGVKIDGVLGFPLFRNTILTLDYPRSRLIMTPAGPVPLVPGARVPFNTAYNVPLIPVELGDRTLLALIDSGSDGPLNLNPVGLELDFVTPPRPGATVASLMGERTQDVGRLAQPLRIGHYVLPQPVVDLTDNLSSLGGEVLRHFTVTFDQARGHATFYRESTTPVLSPVRRSSGLSFVKTRAYWRVAGVVPGSPAAAAGARPGDLITRIDGEPVERWDLQRFRTRVAAGGAIDFTFLDGRTETTRRLAVIDLVP